MLVNNVGMLIGTDEFHTAAIGKVADEVVVNVYSQTMLTKCLMEKLLLRAKKGQKSIIISLAS